MREIKKAKNQNSVRIVEDYACKRFKKEHEGSKHEEYGHMLTSSREQEGYEEQKKDTHEESEREAEEQDQNATAHILHNHLSNNLTEYPDNRARLNHHGSMYKKSDSPVNQENNATKDQDIACNCTDTSHNHGTDHADRHPKHPRGKETITKTWEAIIIQGEHGMVIAPRQLKANGSGSKRWRARVRTITFRQKNALVILQNDEWFMLSHKASISKIRGMVKKAEKGGSGEWERRKVEGEKLTVYYGQNMNLIPRRSGTSKEREEVWSERWRGMRERIERDAHMVKLQAVQKAIILVRTGWLRKMRRHAANNNNGETPEGGKDKQAAEAVDNDHEMQGSDEQMDKEESREEERGNARDRGGTGDKSNQRIRKKTEPVREWNLMQLNVGDMRHRTEVKWKILATMMEEYNLDGIALQELRLREDTSFTAGSDQWPGLALLMTPAIETISKTGEAGVAGGTAFLVRKEHIEEGRISGMRTLEQEGAYGMEDFATVVDIGQGEGETPVQWISAYVRGSGTGHTMEWGKVDTLRDVKGDKIIFGDLNGCVAYAEDIEEWRRRDLGSRRSQRQNEYHHANGKKYKDAWEQAGVTDISAVGRHKWEPTRISKTEGDSEEIATRNKLDVVVVSNRLIKPGRARVTSIGDEMALDTEISDHKSIMMKIRLNNTIPKTRKYEQTERYKLEEFLKNKERQREYARKTDIIGDAIKEGVAKGDSSGKIAQEIETDLKAAAEKDVGKETRRRGRSGILCRSSNGERQALRILRECKRKEGAGEEQGLPEAQLWKRREDTKHAKRKYFTAVRQEKEEKKNRLNKKLGTMTPIERAKYISALIRQAEGRSKDDMETATEATMTFEGRRAKATTPEQIRKLLSGYTYYVSMDTQREQENKKIDERLKKYLTTFKTEGIKKDEFDEEFREEIEERVERIRQETDEGVPNANDDVLNREFKEKEYKEALKTLKEKMRKAPGMDGIWNWMLYKAGKRFHEGLLELFNKCWRERATPETWTRTLISYIYKGKGGRNELTSYRPVGLSSAIMNLFKRMWLARVVKVLAPQIAPNQGGFRKGAGPKEQLWVIVEFINEKMDDDSDACFCTTDVHKAFDQVYRNGTVYLLYAYGIRGTMLTMLTQWITSNNATQLWRGHRGEEIQLDANGLRQGCNLSPILYLLIINAMVSKPPESGMPEWDKGFVEEAFNKGMQTMKESQRGIAEWLVYLFVDDTAFAADNEEDMKEILRCYERFIRKWRIRVNASKCQVMETKSMREKDTEYNMGGEKIRKTRKAKYLGGTLGEATLDTNDKYAEGEEMKGKAVQGRMRVKSLRPYLGEGLTLHYMEAYLTPRIQNGSVFSGVSNASLDGMHMWLVSEALGIGRKFAEEGGHSGIEVQKACVWSDYAGTTWSQRRSIEARRIHRSILRMEENSLPKTLLSRKPRDNILTRVYLPTLLKPKPTKREKEQRIKETTSRNRTPKVECQQEKWKENAKRSARTESRRWKEKLRRELTENTKEREEMDEIGKTIKLGTGTAWIQSLAPARGGSITGEGSKIPDNQKVKIRTMKAGQMPGLKILRHMKEPGWKTLSHEDRKEKIGCGCGMGEIQDMRHMITRCKWTESMREEIKEKTADVMGLEDGRRQAIKEGTIEGAVTILFHERSDKHSKETSKKRCKILCKIHDDIRKILRDKGGGE